MFDIAQRVYNHTYKIDPVIRTLMDTDFYKFLMGNMIFQKYKDVPVTFSLKNRSPVRLADIISEDELRAQLDHTRTLRFKEQELIWLSGNTFYGRRGIFDPSFIDYLRDFQLPPYQLETRDGQFELTFSGTWIEASMWEIPALAIINELKSRAAMESMKRLELDILYANAKAQLWSKVERLRRLDNLKIAEFGTRRRHGFLWQEWATMALAEGLGQGFTGTSNAYLAFKHGLPAIGTNAHELPMVLAALAGEDDEALRNSQYQVLKDWEATYGGSLLVMLPDTFGTDQFLANAPDWVRAWKGVRLDSKDPIIGGEEIISWWTSRGVDPLEKLLLLSDGLDIDDIEAIHARFNGRVQLGFGWGTRLTNDFRHAHPWNVRSLDPVSLVCKVTKAGGRPAVKLSDNPAKATGPSEEIARYVRVFGSQDRIERRVEV